MAGNTIGKLFTVSTSGESHGPGMAAIIDGCPPGMDLSEEDILKDLDKRRPGQSRFTSQRKEPDEVQIISGVFEGKTTGTPINLAIRNVDHKSKDYSDIKDKFRPGHADYTYYHKYGIRDYRGGGRSSARETVMRVAAGAIAKKYLRESAGIEIFGYLSQLGAIEVPLKDKSFISTNPFFAGDPSKIQELEADIAHGLMSINAVKGGEIGAGFSVVTQRGSEHRDEIDTEGFKQNNSGGTLGGISSGQDILASIALKPTSSIIKPAETIDKSGEATEIVTKGRHDPCVGLRATPIGEAMLAIVLMDHYLRHRGQNADVDVSKI